jgi:hypothetical protein
MSEYADKHSNAHRQERVDHILGSTKGKVDASGYEVPGALDTEKKTGPCQPKPRAYAKGGKVEGHKAHHHAGRKSRDAGGTTIQQIRPQVPTGGLYGSGFAPTHAGMLSNAAGLKKGGEAKERACGGAAKSAERREKAKGGGIANEVTGVRITGGRTARAEGGRAKGKTNINIIIGSPKDQGGPPVPPPPSAMPPAPPPPRPGLPPAAMGAMSGPPGAMGGGGPPPGMPPQMPPGMGRG